MTIEPVELSPGYRVPPLIVGCWQVARGHHAEPLHTTSLFDELQAIVELGGTTFDCADIYVGVEELLGRFRLHLERRLGSDAPELQFHTRLTPDLDVLPKITRRYVEGIVDRSLARLGVERLDLVQFHWWDFGVPGYLAVCEWLSDFQRAGKVRNLGVTNFDVPHLRKLLGSGVQVVSNQVQYSLLDRRPENGMVDLCRQQRIKLLGHGVLAGGFLTRSFVSVVAAPPSLSNLSLTKYRLIIEEFGGWDLFQDLLDLLRRIGEHYGVSPSTVAVRYLLDRPQVAALVLGVTRARHYRQNLAALAVRLEEADCERIEELLALARGPTGDVYSLERDQGGPHAAIMSYDLNRSL